MSNKFVESNEYTGKTYSATVVDSLKTRLAKAEATLRDAGYADNGGKRWEQPMTEAVYVTKLRRAARSYLDECCSDQPMTVNAGKALDRWTALRDKISPHTLISMADAWLSRERA